jgi:hypothetical protein
MVHTKVVRVRNDIYPTHLANLPTWISQNPPGSLWVIGNEPDTWYAGQDGVTPEVYADRYYAMAQVIRANDPTAKIGFGPIVQPTPIRLVYLDRVIARLIQIAGSQTAALALIDVYTPHMFILNEEPDEDDQWPSPWGADTPVGITDTASLSLAWIFPDDFDKTHDIETFKQLVRLMRDWMASYGEQDKPLWITEYGSLFPPLDPPDGRDYINVTDEVTRDYMLDTFDYMLTEKDTQIGHPADDYRLVQRFYWFSMNMTRWVFGGALYDPGTRQRTIVGDAFVSYDPPLTAGLVRPDPDIFPESVSVIPLRYTPGSMKTRVDYRLVVRLDNSIPSDYLTYANVNIVPDSGQVGSPQSGYLTRCGGVGLITLDWSNVEPGIQHTLQVTASVQAGSGVDINLTNNSQTYFVTPTTPLELFLPVIRKP